MDSNSIISTIGSIFSSNSAVVFVLENSFVHGLRLVVFDDRGVKGNCG